VRIACPSPDTVAARLRAQDPPIIARVEEGALWLDLRTVTPTDDDLVAKLVKACLHTR
jgi:L-seryl-tRNA(Ser) seleniumtransferase